MEEKVGVGKIISWLISYQVIKIDKNIFNFIHRRSSTSSLPQLVSIVWAVTRQPLSHQLQKLLGVLFWGYCTLHWHRHGLTEKSVILSVKDLSEGPCNPFIFTLFPSSLHSLILFSLSDASPLLFCHLMLSPHFETFNYLIWLHFLSILRYLSWLETFMCHGTYMYQK